MFDCVCDTDVLNALQGSCPEFTNHLRPNIPAKARVSKELRSNQAIQRHIGKGRIVVHELSKADQAEVASLISREFGKESGKRYSQNQMRHEAVEYECAFVASTLKIPAYYYDTKAYANCKRLFRETENASLVRRIDDLIHEAPIPRPHKKNIASHVLRMGYKVDPEVLRRIEFPN